MGDRTLSTAEESRNEHGPYWTIEAQRSAYGQPKVFFTIRNEPYGGGYEPEEMSIVVPDANAFLAPIIAWLNEAAPAPGSPPPAEADVWHKYVVAHSLNGAGKEYSTHQEALVALRKAGPQYELRHYRWSLEDRTVLS